MREEGSFVRKKRVRSSNKGNSVLRGKNFATGKVSKAGKIKVGDAGEGERSRSLRENRNYRSHGRKRARAPIRLKKGRRREADIGR